MIIKGEKKIKEPEKSIPHFRYWVFIKNELEIFHQTLINIVVVVSDNNKLPLFTNDWNKVGCKSATSLLCPEVCYMRGRLWLPICNAVRNIV